MGSQNISASGSHQFPVKDSIRVQLPVCCNKKDPFSKIFVERKKKNWQIGRVGVVLHSTLLGFS